MFEKKAVAWGQNGIPADFSFDELEGHMDEQMMPVLEDAMERVPMLQETGWRKFSAALKVLRPTTSFILARHRKSKTTSWAQA